MKKKNTALILALSLIVVCLIGGTIAWLMDTTEEIENTFTIGKVDISLAETKPTDNTAQMVPGGSTDKDPKVTVEAGSEDCYVYVEITEANNTLTSDASKKFVIWAAASGWTQGDGTNIPANVYYRDGSAGDSWSVLDGDSVSFNDAITNADMTAADTNKPTLTFKAYAIQNANIASAAAGWAELTAD